MKLLLSDKTKKDTFISVFYMLKNCTSVVTIIFKNEELYIQGLDKAHVCLFEVRLKKNWFNEYESFATLEKDEIITIDSCIFYNILSIIEEKQTLCLWYDSGDQLNIEYNSTKNDKGDLNKFFHLPLVDMEFNLLEIPEIENDVDFSMKSKKICDITSQLLIFGDIMNIKCSEDEISISCKGINGEMIVSIPIDDLSDYSIAEGETINVGYSLTYLSKMCMTTKLSPEIEFGVSAEYPMRIKYNLGEGSQFLFFIAPKIE